MRLRLVLAAAALLLAACGDDDETDASDPIETTSAPDDVPEPTTTMTSPPPTPPPPPPADAIALDADIPTRIPAGPRLWQFQVTNTTDAPLVLTFPTAQRGEAVIERDDGTVVHRWSTGRFFTQQVHEVPLAPGQSETIELADDLSGVEPGYYRLLLEPTTTTEIEPITRSIRIVAPGT